jgi:hypothetical protein
MFKTRTRIVLFWNLIALVVALFAPSDLKMGLVSFVAMIMVVHLHAAF